MARPTPARRAALELLSTWRRGQVRVRELMRESPLVEGLDARDRAFTWRLVLGAVRARGLLDTTMDAWLARPGRLEPRLRDALRISTFELLFLSTPAPVAVSQGVELAALAAPRARGLANAVLRRVAENSVPALSQARGRVRAYARGAAVEDPNGALADLSLVAALPPWLARGLMRSMGRDVWHMAALALEPPASTVAANLFLEDAESAFGLLDAAGLSPRRLGWPGAFVLDAPAGLGASGLVEDARILPADYAAQIIAWLAAPGPGTSALLEVGQGRGTKSVLMAGAGRALGADVHVVGIDTSPAKVELAHGRAMAGGAGGAIGSLVFDGRHLGGATLADGATSTQAARLPSALLGPFPEVFVDAPCSGTGTLRRHPEIAWSLEKEALAGTGSLPALQLEILSAASARVGRGGLLFYSTCSELEEENEGVVSAFLSSRAGSAFVVEPPDRAACMDMLGSEARALLASMVYGKGFLRTSRALGAGYTGDGHFLARLRRS